DGLGGGAVAIARSPEHRLVPLFEIGISSRAGPVTILDRLCCCMDLTVETLLGTQAPRPGRWSPIIVRQAGTARASATTTRRPGGLPASLRAFREAPRHATAKGPHRPRPGPDNAGETGGKACGAGRPRGSLTQAVG